MTKPSSLASRLRTLGVRFMGKLRKPAVIAAIIGSLLVVVGTVVELASAVPNTIHYGYRYMHYDIANWPLWLTGLALSLGGAILIVGPAVPSERFWDNLRLKRKFRRERRLENHFTAADKAWYTAESLHVLQTRWQLSAAEIERLRVLLETNRDFAKFEASFLSNDHKRITLHRDVNGALVLGADYGSNGMLHQIGLTNGEIYSLRRLRRALQP